jgi:alpha-N-acetylglucosamine transferase
MKWKKKRRKVTEVTISFDEVIFINEDVVLIKGIKYLFDGREWFCARKQ